MKAALCQAYGPPEVVRLSALPDPAPAPDEVLIRVRASTVASADHRIRALDLPPGFRLMGRLALGFRRPRRAILGTDLSGIVQIAGRDVTGFEPGQPVIAMPGWRMGAHAEFLVMKARAAIAPKPAALDFAEAAALCFGGTTALYFLRDRAGLQAGESLLITGAGGAVGSAAAQIARAWGAHVTGLAGHGKLAALQGLGFDDLIAASDGAQITRRWDVILDCAGIAGARQARDWLKPGGRLCLLQAGPGQMLGGLILRPGQGRRVLTGAAPERAGDLQILARMADAGQLRPLIGARMPFDSIVAAHHLVSGGHKLGNIVIEMD